MYLQVKDSVTSREPPDRLSRCLSIRQVLQPTLHGPALWQGKFKRANLIIVMHSSFRNGQLFLLQKLLLKYNQPKPN